MGKAAAMEGNRAKKVAILFSLKRKAERSTFLGILDHVGKSGRWFCLFDERWSGERMADFPKTGVDGIIVSRTGFDDAREIAALRVPVVFVEPGPEREDPDYPLRGIPYVRRDSRAIGAMAARYFVSRGYRSFAFVDLPSVECWSRERHLGFGDALAERGFGFAVFDSSTAGEKRDWPTERERMVRFLRELPRETAVFAPADHRARNVLEACLFAGLRVPDEIAVLGVDDDPLICDSTVPSLSSIHTGGFRRGQIAAAMLDDLMSGRQPRECAISQPPIGIVTRDSTGYAATSDAAISRAVAFVRRNAGDGNLDVAAVVRASGCSRRTLEGRFRAKLGFSVRDAIIRERIERVKALLAAGSLSIGEITERTNFVRESHLAKLFKQVTGVTMTEWRRENRDTL